MGAPSIDAVTRTGLTIRLRLGASTDADALMAGFSHLGEESRYHRFFTAMPRLPDHLLQLFLDLDGQTRLAIGAFDPARPSEVGTDDGLGIGVSRYLPAADDEQAAELAVTVIDEYQGQGVGRVLLEALVVGALHGGLRTLYGYVMYDNAGMVRLFRKLGGRDQHTDRPEPGARRLAIDVEAAVTSLGPRRDLYAQLFT
jgi:GNAT superfamily N-acetyltransferase